MHCLTSISQPANEFVNVSMKLINYGGPTTNVTVRLDGFGDALGVVRVETLSGSMNNTNSLAHNQVALPSLETEQV